MASGVKLTQTTCVTCFYILLITFKVVPPPVCLFILPSKIKALRLMPDTFPVSLILRRGKYFWLNTLHNPLLFYFVSLL